MVTNAGKGVGKEGPFTVGHSLSTITGNQYKGVSKN